MVSPDYEARYHDRLVADTPPDDLMYEPGDYARAALIALAEENTDDR